VDIRLQDCHAKPQWSISCVLLISITLPAPTPRTTVFFTRLLLTQTYCLLSPRRPNEPPHRPEAARNHVLYQVGRPHKAHEKHPGHELNCLWRGSEAGAVEPPDDDGWRTKAVARLPNHDKIRPSTNDG
jgi:hypothetical protein